MINIRKAHFVDIVAISGRLREQDEKEIIEAGNSSVAESLRYSLSRSLVSYCVDIDGIPQALFGLVPDSLLGETACVWFLGTKEMSKIKKSFVKKSREVVNYWLTQYSILWNIFPKSYVETCRWLSAMGAEFKEMNEPKGFILFKLERR